MRYITRRARALTAAVLLAATLPALVGLAPAAGAASAPKDGPDSAFYQYSGTTPLSDLAPGTVLKSRTFTYWGLMWPVTVDQLLYRSTDALDRPTVNVTSVLHPTGWFPQHNRAVVMATAYDSLDVHDEPSAQIADDVAFANDDVGGLLGKGLTVIVPDTEGQDAEITAGRVYGHNTLDAIRAAMNATSVTGLDHNARLALSGYSGGAWAAMWAAQLAPTYAPDVNARLVGVTVGGLPVNAAHTSEYLSGSLAFAAELPTAIIGMARAYDVDFTPYLSPLGAQLYEKYDQYSLGDAIIDLPFVHFGLTMSDLLKPQYANPNSIPEYVRIVNDNNLGTAGAATVPVQIVQGGTGWTLGTADHPTLGNGDGAAVTGDVRTLARQFCAAGTAVSYTQLDWNDHLTAYPTWASNSTSWIDARLAGTAAPSNCSSIAPGNSLAPEQVVPSGS